MYHLLTSNKSNSAHVAFTACGMTFEINLQVVKTGNYIKP